MNHELITIDLKNGARGLLINVPGARVVNLTVGFNSGTIFCNQATKPELSHVVEHVMFGANDLFPTRKLFTAEIEKNGAYNNAATSHFFNWYEYECAAFETERILNLMCAQLTSPKFLKDEVETEIGNVREELSNFLTNYDRSVYDILMHAMFGRATITGSLRTLPNIDRRSIVDYWKRTHTAQNMSFIFAGALGSNPQQLVKQFQAGIEGLEQNKRLDIKREDVSLPRKAIVDHVDIPQIYYMFSQVGPVFLAEEEPILDILDIILTGHYNSWILGEARERGLAYHVQSNISNSIHRSRLDISAFATPRNIEALFRLIAQKLKTLKKIGITAEELEDAKQLLVGRRLRQYKTPGQLLSWYQFDFLARGKVLEFDEAVGRIKTITQEDVKRVVEQLLAEPRWGLALVGKVSNKKAERLRTYMERIWE
jgi:predicted Zn-dependent peptidase